jgi:hypothetical protein
MTPGHYDGEVEPIDLIESQDLNFHQGNIVKYACRYPDKGGKDDIEKLIWYAERLLENYEE